MRVGVFAVMAGRQAGGPETYERSLMASLARLDHHNDYRIYCLDRSGPAVFPPDAPNIQCQVLWPQQRVLSTLCSLPWMLVRQGVDLLHATFTPPPLSPKPYVFTHHCFSTFAHPEFYDPAILLRLNALLKQGLKHAQRIICVSDNVRQLTAERFGIPLERMTVVHNGVGDHFVPTEPAQAQAEVSRRFGIDTPYLLFTGKLESRKNIVRLLEAFKAFRAETQAPVTLVLAGRRTPMSQGIDEALDRLDLREVVKEIGHVDISELPLLYSGAAMFVFPSLWEGFGIPVIEAMACGTPVLTSKLSSLPEVAGDAALLIDPYQVDDIAGGMLRLWRDGELRDQLRRRGLARAERFSWDDTARQTMAVYRDAKAA
jgi:glycosyltransferase involved in cell wall biosynthesis